MGMIVPRRDTLLRKQKVGGKAVTQANRQHDKKTRAKSKVRAKVMRIKAAALHRKEWYASAVVKI